MRIQVTVDTSGINKLLLDLQGRQLPFATSLAINSTAKLVQAAQREEIRRNFKIRRPWVLLGVKVIKWAKKQSLSAIIVIDQSRDFLNKFELGGTKLPRGKHLALPDDVRASPMDIVRKGMRPKSFAFTRAGSGSKATMYKGNRRTFLLEMPGSGAGIYQRTGKGKGSLRKLWSFRTAVRIKPILHFHLTAQRVVSKVFSAEFGKAWNRALATARR